MTLDISKKAVKDTCDVLLDDASGEPLYDDEGNRCSITIYGPGTREYARAQSRRNQHLIERMQAKGRKVDRTAEDNAEFLAEITVSFNNFTYKSMSGHEQHKACYLDGGIGYIAEQVSRACGDWANFTDRSATI